jgi:hypothetical protein
VHFRGDVRIPAFTRSSDDHVGLPEAPSDGSVNGPDGDRHYLFALGQTIGRTHQSGIFDSNRYFDVFVEYAKADVEDIFIKITVANRGSEPANLRLLPTVWFRNTPNPVLDLLPCMKERGRLKVDENLRVPDWPGVGLGDCALVPDRKTGQYHPPTAQHALREGKTLATNLIASVRGGTLKPFSFRRSASLQPLAGGLGLRTFWVSTSPGLSPDGCGEQFISASFRGSRRSFGLRLIGPWFFCSPRIWCSSRRFVRQRSPT